MSCLGVRDFGEKNTKHASQKDASVSSKKSATLPAFGDSFRSNGLARATSGTTGRATTSSTGVMPDGGDASSQVELQAKPSRRIVGSQ
jgi:hypothetical protein